MRQSIVAALLGFALALSAAPNAFAQPQRQQLGDIQISSLAVRVDGESASFEVIDARMDETATAAVLFGMIGAVVNSADNNMEDERKAEPLRATAEAIDLNGLISQALVERLASRNSVTLAAEGAEPSNTLVVDIGDWGLVRRAQRPDSAMRVFLKLNVSVLDARGRRVWGPQREHSIGQMSVDLSQFTPEVFRAEMETLAARAGQQVANRVIYR